MIRILVLFQIALTFVSVNPAYARICLVLELQDYYSQASTNIQAKVNVQCPFGMFGSLSKKVTLQAQIISYSSEESSYFADAYCIPFEFENCKYDAEVDIPRGIDKSETLRCRGSIWQTPEHNEVVAITNESNQPKCFAKRSTSFYEIDR